MGRDRLQVEPRSPDATGRAAADGFPPLPDLAAEWAAFRLHKALERAEQFAETSRYASRRRREELFAAIQAARRQLELELPDEDLSRALRLELERVVARRRGLKPEDITEVRYVTAFDDEVAKGIAVPVNWTEKDNQVDGESFFRRLKFTQVAESFDSLGAEYASFQAPDRLADLHLTALYRPVVQPGSPASILVYLHCGQDRDKVMRAARLQQKLEERGFSSATTCSSSLGLAPQARLELSGVEIWQDRCDLAWSGDIASGQLKVRIPRQAKAAIYRGELTFEWGGRNLGNLQLSLEVAAPEASSIERRKSAFVSYSRKDCRRIRWCLESLTADPEMVILIDQVNLRRGDLFPEKIGKMIRDCAVFYLFWSRHAARSDWVRWELDNAKCVARERRLALSDFIRLVVLDHFGRRHLPEDLKWTQATDPVITIIRQWTFWRRLFSFY